MTEEQDLYLTQADLESLAAKKETIRAFFAQVDRHPILYTHYGLEDALRKRLELGQAHYHDDYREKDCAAEAQEEALDGMLYFFLETLKPGLPPGRKSDCIDAAAAFYYAWCIAESVRLHEGPFENMGKEAE